MSHEPKPERAGSGAARLIEAIAANRDREAFTRLFEHFAPRVKSLMLRSGATSGQAEELAQETLLIVWRKAELFDPARAGPAAWIFTIARNLRIDGLRRAGREANAVMKMDVAADDVERPDDLFITAEQDEGVRAALKCLNEDQRRVVHLSFIQDKPHAEIARELGIPVGTVKSRIRLAMSRLRQVLDDRQ
jgi:RNA polymerase sigma-70 factor (ECF subfamily)